MFKLLVSLSILALSACTTMVPNSEICMVSGVLAAGGDCVMTQTDATRSMDLDGWISFLESDPATGKGAAVCTSSEDYQKNKTALEQLCKKAGVWCTKEIKDGIAKTDGRVMGLQQNSMRKKRERDPKGHRDRIAPSGA